MPQGVARALAYSICRRTIARLVRSIMLSVGARMISVGMRYSNIEPDQDSKAAPPWTTVTACPSRNQCRGGKSPLAMAMKLARRASEASRS